MFYPEVRIKQKKYSFSFCSENIEIEILRIIGFLVVVDIGNKAINLVRWQN